MLEIGCGMGLHSWLWHQEGFSVMGVDVSSVGIRHAARAYPGPRFVAADLADLEVPARSFDVLFARGMSWFHYELDGVNAEGVDVPARTDALFTCLRPGGTFVLQIATDFSGDGRGRGGVHFNRLPAYRRLLRRGGYIVLAANWRGDALPDQETAERLGGNLLIAARVEQGADRVPAQASQRRAGRRSQSAS